VAGTHAHLDKVRKRTAALHWFRDNTHSPSRGSCRKLPDTKRCQHPERHAPSPSKLGKCHFL
jgi:hypothetical protein